MKPNMDSVRICRCNLCGKVCDREVWRHTHGSIYQSNCYIGSCASRVPIQSTNIKNWGKTLDCNTANDVSRHNCINSWDEGKIKAML